MNTLRSEPLTSQNAQTKGSRESRAQLFLIPVAVIAAFALMFVGVLATLSHHLTASIETVLLDRLRRSSPSPAPWQ